MPLQRGRRVVARGGDTPALRQAGEVQRYGHPFRASLTAAINSLIVTEPFRSRSAAAHAEIGLDPILMLTARISSLIDTISSPLQSPAHAMRLAVGVGGAVDVG